MEYKIEKNNLKIQCELAEKEKTLEQCKKCPVKQNCNNIENSIKKDVQIKNDIEFRKFIYNEDCPECKICLWGDKTKIEDCNEIDKESLIYKELKEKFDKSDNKYILNENKLQNLLKEIKDE